MGLFQWLGTILVSGIVSWSVAWYQLRKHEDIEAKKEHLNQIKQEIIEPLLNALKSRGEITQTDDMILVYSDSRSVGIPLTFFENVKRYHFPELCILDEYLLVQRELQNAKREIDERLKFLVKKLLAYEFGDSPIRQGFQTCTLDIDFELEIEKAIYRFLSSNLCRLRTWDWQRDFEENFKASISSGYQEIYFGNSLIYKEPAPQGTSTENWASPVKFLLFSIVKNLVNNNSVKQLVEKIDMLKQQHSEKRNELKEVLEHIKYVQKLPLRKRRWRLIKEPCPCLKEH